MATKLTVFLGCLVTVAKAGLLPAAPLGFAPAAGVAVAAPLVKSVTDYDPHPQYTYAYDVQDSLTGDAKSQHETRNGDVVTGSYSLIEADGTRRVVEYTADPVNGFNAVVHREPAVVKAAVVPAPAVVQPGLAKFAYHPAPPAFALRP
ncbi:larval cuticle protein A2B-like [Venturia canescens]|uniref:larval cuticle protein A2B-like n=1 Tax=Venturia canescens TaxID=32260 RepID=UPI001C9D24A3|nr:larval cuticle protein A2B-like [Venturia canescens]